MARAYRPSRLNPSAKKVSSSSKVPLSKHQLARKAKTLKRIATEKANAPRGLILTRLKKKYGIDQNKHKQSKSNKEEVEVVKKTEKSERFVEIDETEVAKEVKDNDSSSGLEKVTLKSVWTEKALIGFLGQWSRRVPKQLVVSIPTYLKAPSVQAKLLNLTKAATR